MFEGNHPVFKNLQRCSRTNRPYPKGQTNGINLLRQAVQPGIKPAFHTLPSSFLPFDPPFQVYLWGHTLALAIAAAIPGPGVAAVIARALGAGFPAALPLIAGIVLGDLVFLSLAILGLSFIAEILGTVFFIVKWLGAAFLAYLAYTLWTATEEAITVESAAGEKSAGRSLIAGFLLTLGNPKTILFYMALLPSLIDLSSVTVTDFLSLGSVVIVVLLAVLFPYALVAAQSRVLLRSARSRRVLNRCASLTMAGAAVAVVSR